MKARDHLPLLPSRAAEREPDFRSIARRHAAPHANATDIHGDFRKASVHSTITAIEAPLCGLCSCLGSFILACKVLSILDRLVKSV
jgi:hypothetical protein